jgi:LytS/YehU family sensor histidine kinase
LRLGVRETIPLAEELALVEKYLAIEQRRFGNRLRVSCGADEDVASCAVPPLILQPLVENAVNHGIADLLEGGEVRIACRRRGERVAITVENPFDPAGEGRAGEGVGLANVRARLLACYGPDASLDVRRGARAFSVELELPTKSAGQPLD